MAERTTVPGGSPVDEYTPVSVDNTTIEGNGTPTAPLAVVAGALEVVTDGVTIGGEGRTGSPLHAIFTGFYDNVKVVPDGITIIGSGITGDPLIATGGAPGSTHVQPFTYTVTGLEPDLENITIPIVPSQPDGNYQVTVTQGVHAAFYGMAAISKAGAHFVLQLSSAASAGDTFDIQLARAS